MKVSMSTVWDRTSEFLSNHLSKITGMIAVLFIATVVQGLPEAIFGPNPGIGAALIGFVVSLAMFVATAWAQLGITAAAIDPAAPASERATKRLPAMIVVMLVLIAAAIVLALPIVGMLISGGADLTRLGQPDAFANFTPGMAGGIGLYVLVLVVFLFWASARFMVLLTSVVVAEDLSLGAFGRAFALSRGLTWRIIGVMILFGIVMLVAVLAASMVVGAILGLAIGGAGASAGAQMVVAILAGIVLSAVATIFTVLATVFCAKLYLATREREGAAPAA